MLKETIYLIGQISTDEEETYLWRQEVKKYFKNNNGNFEIIDPCANEWNRTNTNFNGDDIYRLKLYNQVGSGLIVPKDHNYVLRSTGCIANMNHYDLNKPFIGTLFELAWYYQNPEKCVVGVFYGNPKEDIYCNHPFIRETVDVWCKDHIEASMLLLDFYGEH